MTDPLSSQPPEPARRIRSFVVRAGRMTDAQRLALDTLWPRFGLDAPAAGAAPLDLSQCFGREAPRTLEIGFGNGETLAALAMAHPERDYLGIEVHRPGAGHLLRLAEQHALANLRVWCADAVEVLEHGLAPGSLDEVLILFADPWHKKRHHKRRLIQAAFVDLLASRLRSGGRLHLATDWEPYAQQMLEVLNASAAFANESADGGFVPRPAWRTLTRFERRGERLGHGVWDLTYRRR
jgi:tRNA (guanine-N7-)-methyltransferase